jgi:short subunit fatty acids transporter
MSIKNVARALSLVLLLLLATIIVASIAVPAAADCEEELAATKEELNATKEQLAKVEKERDDYGQRLEDSTTILIVVLFLLIASFLFFWINMRRQKIFMYELEKRTGITPDSPDPKPRRRRRG